MSEQRDNERPESERQELRRLVRLLAGLAKTARDASLTGQLSGGKAVSVRQFNAILARLKELGAVTGDIFSLLPDDASFDEVGVAASQLAAFLREEEDDDPPRRRWRQGGGVFEATPHGVKIVGFPGNISELGELVRDHLQDFVKGRVGCRAEEARTEAGTANGAPPPPPPPPDFGGGSGFGGAGFGGGPGGTSSRLEEIDRRLTDVAAGIRSATDRIRAPEAGPEEIRQIVDELTKLSREQAELTREQAEITAGAL